MASLFDILPPYSQFLHSVTDLLKNYKDIGFTYFRKGKIVADHFHWTLYACDAVNRIRV